MSECVFCRILSGTEPSAQLYEDEDMIVIRDIRPVAPLHVLIIPRKHISSLNELQPEDAALAGRLLLAVPRIARQLLGNNAAYRTIINTGAEAGQTVFHLHVHIISGRPYIGQLITRGLR
ncbi:MAG TPA: HIT domain-containing protein [Anaerolineaceae bacterium]|nr:HIT domain-containing protein [Anaerolineaceae bacterium]